MFAAAAANADECISLLCNAGAAVDSANTHGVTPLQIAAVKNNERSLHLLLSLGADVALADDAGNTALHKPRGRTQRVRSMHSSLTSAAAARPPLRAARRQPQWREVPRARSACAGTTLVASTLALHRENRADAARWRCTQARWVPRLDEGGARRGAARGREGGCAQAESLRVAEAREALVGRARAAEGCARTWMPGVRARGRRDGRARRRLPLRVAQRESACREEELATAKNELVRRRGAGRRARVARRRRR